MIRRHGFTLIELLVVMSVIATLLLIAYPRYFSSIDKSKEAALRQDLSIMRDALDKYHGDIGQFPQSLNDLVEKGYLRAIPPDPITESLESWILVSPSDNRQSGIANIRSGAPGSARDGSLYADW